ncbi:hypothetical protein QOT17_007561 [Balamuthia mandrillaris]
MGDLLVHYRTSGQGLVKQLGNRLHLWLHRMPKWQPRAKRFHFERRWEDTSSFTSFGGSTSTTWPHEARAAHSNDNAESGRVPMKGRRTLLEAAMQEHNTGLQEERYGTIPVPASEVQAPNTRHLKAG